MIPRIQLTIVLVAALAVAACVQPGTGYYRPDLNDDIIARVSLGQSEAEIITLLGTPYQRIRFDDLKSTAWDYVYKDTWGYWVNFSVMVGDNGRVVNKISSRIEPVDKK